MTHRSEKKALVTGIAGQDGSYLAELLLEKGYEVHGVVRPPSERTPGKPWRIAHLLGRVTLHDADITDEAAMRALVNELQPDEIYHLAGVTVSKLDFEHEPAIFRHNFDAVLYLLRAIKELSPSSKFFFAASAAMYGNQPPSPQDENTPFRPTTPYAIAKSAAFYLVKMYREAHGVFAVSGILFNHESPRRGLEFVTRKISMSVAKIKLGLARELVLGNLDAARDWAFAGDYVKAFWVMLQAEMPGDYVIGSGETHTVREFVEEAFKSVGMDYQAYVKTDPTLIAQRSEVAISRANPKKIMKELSWKPTVSFHELATMMVKADLERTRDETHT